MLEEDKKAYQGSAEERGDIAKAYTQAKGDLNSILDSVLHAAVLDDEDRITAIIHDLIATDQLPPYDAFLKESKAKRAMRHKRAAAEAAEAEAALKKRKDKKAVCAPVASHPGLASYLVPKPSLSHPSLVSHPGLASRTQA